MSGSTYEEEGEEAHDIDDESSESELIVNTMGAWNTTADVPWYEEEWNTTAGTLVATAHPSTSHLPTEDRIDLIEETIWNRENAYVSLYSDVINLYREVYAIDAHVNSIEKEFGELDSEIAELSEEIPNIAEEKIDTSLHSPLTLGGGTAIGVLAIILAIQGSPLALPAGALSLFGLIIWKKMQDRYDLRLVDVI